MTPHEFKAIRQKLKLSTVQFGRAFGYSGSDNSASVSIRTYESGGRPIPEYMARLAIMFGRYGVPPEFRVGGEPRHQPEGQAPSNSPGERQLEGVDIQPRR